MYSPKVYRLIYSESAGAELRYGRRLEGEEEGRRREDVMKERNRDPIYYRDEGE